MKNLMCSLLAVGLLLASCQPKQNVPTDTTAAKSAVTTQLEKFHAAFQGKDMITLASMLDSTGLYCGTDPQEMFTKETFLNSCKQAFSDTAIKLAYAIDKMEIRVSNDGNSAISMEQYNFKLFTPKISWRAVAHLSKTGDNWMIDFISWSLIPKNADIEKLNKALE